MVKSGTDKLFEKFTEGFKPRWSYADSILYGMCRERPRHDIKDVAASKLFLISKGFFNTEGQDEDYYYDIVAPRMQSEASNIDYYISLLNEDCRTIAKSRTQILEAHKFLMDIFDGIKAFDNRVMSSGYLHFHCPAMVYLYTRAAGERICKIVTPEGDREIPARSDAVYLEFFDKALELQTFLYEESGIYRSPIEINRFLRSGDFGEM